MIFAYTRTHGLLGVEILEQQSVGGVLAEEGGEHQAVPTYKRWSLKEQPGDDVCTCLREREKKCLGGCVKKKERQIVPLDRHQLYQDVQRRARGVFERVAHRVADHRCLVRLRALAADGARLLRVASLQILLGVVPRAARVGRANGDLQAPKGEG